ncbi:MAG: DUF2079 domain-containing protein [Geminocystis sp.]|nr:DUF2079 domain-containing protein [Geminocystis sp.]
MQYFKFLNALSLQTLFSFLILFLASVIRHLLFHSAAYDLGIFDNAVYLISRGKNPYITFRGLHILGDHAAFILYPIATLYSLYPSVYWLFFIQSLSLSLAVLPLIKICSLFGINGEKSRTICLVYWLYPVIFNVNIFDFHPETIATPLFFIATLASNAFGNSYSLRRRWYWFVASIILILGCKAVLSLNVAAMGLWLLLFRRRKIEGLVATSMGVLWFIISSQIVIPKFSGEEAAAVGRYSYLGNSVIEIIVNVFTKPKTVLSHLLTLPNLEYLTLLFIPVIPIIAWQEIDNLLPAIPTIVINLLADYLPQKNLVYQYSIPIVPFLIITAVASLGRQKTLLSKDIKIRIWALIMFLALTRWTAFLPITPRSYWRDVYQWQATRKAIELIDNKEVVFTNHRYAPHLTHRETVYLADETIDYQQVVKSKYILLNAKNPGYPTSQEEMKRLINFLLTNNDFILVYQRDDIFLFTRKN